MPSSAWAAQTSVSPERPVFDKRPECKARCSALPARALHKGPFVRRVQSDAVSSSDGK